MAAVQLGFVQNEFYELHNPAQVPIGTGHPHPPLTPFRIVMVADITFNGGRVIFKWPSYHSLAYFDSDKLDILPTLDQKCALSHYEASRIVRGPIDPVDLCFNQGWTINPWVHDFNQARSHMNLVDIPEAHSNHTLIHRMRTDNFYAVSWADLPEEIGVRLKGFPRIAWVSREFEGQSSTGQNVTLHVEVRVPSKASLKKFEQSLSSSALPDFDQVFSTTAQFAMLFLSRIVPVDLCFQLRRHRDFWINVQELKNQPSRASKLFGCVIMKNSG